MIPPLPEGYDVPVAPLWPSILPGVGMIVAGIALLWWKCRQIGMKFREFRELMKTPPVITEQRKQQLGIVTIEVEEGKPWRAAMLDPLSYRDDTGKRGA